MSLKLGFSVKQEVTTGDSWKNRVGRPREEPREHSSAEVREGERIRVLGVGPGKQNPELWGQYFRRKLCGHLERLTFP